MKTKHGDIKAKKWLSMRDCALAKAKKDLAAMKLRAEAAEQKSSKKTRHEAAPPAPAASSSSEGAPPAAGDLV